MAALAGTTTAEVAAQKPNEGNRFSSQGQLLARMRVAGMCTKCAELDRKIEHLRWMIGQMLDPQTIKAAKDLIKIMEAEKARYHSE
jgi:hypothetical protein